MDPNDSWVRKTQRVLKLYDAISHSFPCFAFGRDAYVTHSDMAYNMVSLCFFHASKKQ